MHLNIKTICDKQYMQQAITLAKKGMYTASPNPNVGCVIVKDGLIVGRGYHYKAGHAHAETYALDAAGTKAKGADLYVTLEPCCHFGKTPPCVDKVINSGVKRVIIGMADPFHKVSGMGIKKLQSFGIEVIVGCLEEEVRELNLGYISRIVRNRPWITIKIGASLDGRTALSNGKSRWITCEDSRIEVHCLRARSDVIIVGSNTVIADNPKLNVRNNCTNKLPIRLVIDSSLKTNPEAAVYNPDTIRIVATNKNADTNKIDLFRQKDVEVWDDVSLVNRINLPSVILKLAKNNVNYVMIESGMNLNARFLENNLFDEIIVYLSPIILGNKSFGMFNIPELTNLRNMFNLQFHSIEKLGTDLKITLRKSFYEEIKK